MKKAQVTIFIIIGLFLLIGVGLFSYFQSEIFRYKNLPEQFIPVAKYAEQCMNDVALEGIFQAGMNGGYIYKQYEEPEAYLDAGFPVPYWFLAGEDRSVTLLKLETDLNQYIEENLNSCLNNFDAFHNQFIMSSITNISADVSITSSVVTVKVEIPVEIQDETTSATLPELQVDIDNTIGNKLFLAYQIMKAENEQGFLEYYTNEIIAASDWLPYEGMDFTCKPKRWLLNDMKVYIEKAVSVNLPFIMFEDTSYTETGDLYYDNIYKMNLGVSGVSNLKITTSYDPQWGMELDVQPNNNGVVTDVKMVGNTIAIPCVKVYHHKYSLTYPVLFEVTDEDSSEYPFFFAVPVIMKRNEPDRYNEMQPWPSETDTIRSKQYCSPITKTTEYILNADNTITTQESEQDNWQYSLDIIAMDHLYGFDGILEDVTITYQCVQFDCEIGETEYGSGDSLIGYPLLSSEFPTCLNGQLKAEKEGYQPVKMFQSVTAETDGATVQFEMFKLKQLNFDVTVVQNHNDVVTERNLEEDETAVITLRNEEQEFEKIVVYPIDDSFDTFELMVADDVTYTVDVKLIKGDTYAGTYIYNWTPDANSITAASAAHMYVIVKDVLLPTDENYQEAMQYGEEQSIYYPPYLT
ncbi:MAG: hypothetical protein WC254_01675 [Candidatus Woesearchaeota archaeon]|jgi:hypothetical protein